MVDSVTKAKTSLSALKLSFADKKVRNLQTTLDELNTTFDITRLEELKALSALIASLTPEEKRLVDLANYNALVSSYNAYCNSINTEMVEITTAIDNTFLYVNAAIASLSVLAMAILFGKKYF